MTAIELIEQAQCLSRQEREAPANALPRTLDELHQTPLYAMLPKDWALSANKLPISAVTHQPKKPDRPMLYVSAGYALTEFWKEQERGKRKYDATLMHRTHSGMFPLDYDDCYRPDTQELTTWGQDFLGMFPTVYQERSMSGTGAHLLLPVDVGLITSLIPSNLKKPVPGVPGAFVEMRPNGHMCWTWNMIQAPATYQPQESVHRALETLLHTLTIRSFTVPAPTPALHRKHQYVDAPVEVETYGQGDWSVADFHKCVELAQEHGCDKVAIDAAFRQCALFRPDKCDSRREAISKGGRTYLQKTIDVAVRFYQRRVLHQSETTRVELCIDACPGLTPKDKLLLKGIRRRVLYGYQDAWGFVRVNYSVLADAAHTNRKTVQRCINFARKHKLVRYRKCAEYTGDSVKTPVDLAITARLRDENLSELPARKPVGRPPRQG